MFPNDWWVIVAIEYALLAAILVGAWKMFEWAVKWVMG